MRAPIVVLVVFTFLGGCSDNLFGMCPTHFPGATWEEPGIYAGLSAISTDIPAGPGLPFESRETARPGILTSVGWSGYPGFDEFPRVMKLESTPGSAEPDPVAGHRDIRIPGLFGPTATVTVEEGTPATTIRAAFTALLQNVTSGTEEQIEAWSQKGARQSEWARITTSRDGRQIDFLAFRVSVPGPFRLDDLYNETGATRKPQTLYSGSEWHQGASWSFSFSFSERNATLPGGVEVMADTRDVIEADLPGYPLTTNSSLAQIKEGFAAVGIEVEGPRPDQFSKAVC